MKLHIVATIDNQVLHDVDRFAREGRQSRSQIIEMALEEFLQKRGSAEDEIVTSAGRFEGEFRREDTYEKLHSTANESEPARRSRGQNV